MRRLALLLLLGPPPLALAACDRTPVARVDGTAVAVRLTDYRLHPQRLRAVAGPLTFSVRNDGRVPHNLQIRTDAGAVRGRVATLLPGASGRMTVRLRRGEYELLSTVGRDEQLGQRGTVTVR